MKKIGYIYRFISPSGKSYIGLTTTDPETRKEQHRKAAEKGLKYALYEAIRKYGFDSFKFEVLYTLIEYTDLKRELDSLETYYIGIYDSFKNGYNMTIGGDSSGKTCGKLISSYTKEGEYITTFDSAEEAARILGHPKSSSTIRKCARTERGSSLGFLWRNGDLTDNIGKIILEEVKHPIMIGTENPRSKKVYLYSKDGSLLHIWNTALEAEREARYSSTEISKAATGKKSTLWQKRRKEMYLEFCRTYQARSFR